jgi:hypothetical protein
MEASVKYPPTPRSKSIMYVNKNQSLRIETNVYQLPLEGGGRMLRRRMSSHSRMSRVNLRLAISSSRIWQQGVIFTKDCDFNPESQTSTNFREIMDQEISYLHIAT